MSGSQSQRSPKERILEVALALESFDRLKREPWARERATQLRAAVKEAFPDVK